MSSKKNILLTGGSGSLGSEIIKSNLFNRLISPSKKELDITKPEAIEIFFNKNDFDSVIHCAALARMALCQESPEKAIKVNVIGASNLVHSIIELEKRKNKIIRFVHISTDGVYASKIGNYSEKSTTIPYNHYGWTKLGAECVIRLLSNYTIIRTRFFNPDNIPFDNSAIDVFTSSLPIGDLVKAIYYIHNLNFVGVINVGGERLSDFDRYKKYKPSIKPCKREDIIKNLHFEIAKDASMDCNLWYDLLNK